jgi:hypothetical protein
MKKHQLRMGPNICFPSFSIFQAQFAKVVWTTKPFHAILTGVDWRFPNVTSMLMARQQQQNVLDCFKAEEKNKQ